MTVKRRTIWLSDEEWTRLLNRATSAKTSASRAIVKALDDADDWESENAYAPPYVPGPPVELTADVLRAMGGSTDGGRILPDDHILPDNPTIEYFPDPEGYAHLDALRAAGAVARPFAEFRPVPKPGSKR